MLLRGMNVGGKRKVSMFKMKAQLPEVVFDKVTSYINSGNTLMTSKFSHEKT
ncbi:DUF1697 domain-containing protein [Fundicoccus sp. Sow4_D5]|uniref:DUF1697 domain-containing protein n=1 Tax=Fundicoccus sp. Sow4_D5 TaxID=3438782 RepID=UPI003F934AF1